MSNAINRIVQNDAEKKEQKIKDLKASISIAAHTIRIVENSDMKGREAFIVIDSLSWLHTIKQSLDAELLKVEPKKDDAGSPAGNPADEKNPAPAANPLADAAPVEKTLEVVK